MSALINRLKAAYVSLYLTVASVISAYAVWQLLEGHDALTWSGVLLSAAPMALVIGFLMIKPVMARTSADLPEAHVPIAIGVALTAWGTSGNDWFPLTLAVISYVGFLLYVYWYSRYGRVKSDALSIGKVLPAFTLLDVDRNEVNSSELSGKPAVILFYRGNWCPLCMAQIKEIAKQYQELEALGAEVIMVSPQPHKYTRELAEKFNVNFRFMTDKDNQAAKVLGIASEFGIPTGLEAMGYDTEAPMPTVIITDKQGTVVWTHETDNYRVRPEPETFLEVIRAL